EWHYTPKHGSWLNMAETEIRIMNGQCLSRRMDSQAKIAHEVAAWERKRNALQARIHWTFTLAPARRKLSKLYPPIEDGRDTRQLQLYEGCGGKERRKRADRAAFSDARQGL